MLWGRALFRRFQLPDGLRRCAIFLVQEKVMQGTSRSADSRAYRRIALKSLELVVVSRSVAFAFCGRLWVQQQQRCNILTQREIGRLLTPIGALPRPYDEHMRDSLSLSQGMEMGMSSLWQWPCCWRSSLAVLTSALQAFLVLGRLVP